MGYEAAEVTKVCRGSKWGSNPLCPASDRKALGVEDAERTERAIKGAAGKRLTYWRTRSAA
jgi:hypothetical protein